jgi:hypothetical protein
VVCVLLSVCPQELRQKAGELMRRASRAFASLFDKGRGLMVPRGSGGQVRVLTLVAFGTLI